MVSASYQSLSLVYSPDSICPLASLAILYLFHHISPAFSTIVRWLHWLLCCSRARFARNFILYPPSMIHRLLHRLAAPLVNLLHSGSPPLFFLSIHLSIPSIQCISSIYYCSKHQLHTLKTPGGYHLNTRFPPGVSPSLLGYFKWRWPREVCFIIETFSWSHIPELAPLPF